MGKFVYTKVKMEGPIFPLKAMKLTEIFQSVFLINETMFVYTSMTLDIWIYPNHSQTT